MNNYSQLEKCYRLSEHQSAVSALSVKNAFYSCSSPLAVADCRAGVRASKHFRGVANFFSFSISGNLGSPGTFFGRPAEGSVKLNLVGGGGGGVWEI